MSGRNLPLIVLLIAIGLAGAFAWRWLSPSEPAPTSKSPAATPEALADLFIAALNSQDEATMQTVQSLSTGYEALADTLREAALNEPDLLSRLDLSPQQRLTVLALRDQHRRGPLTRLDPWDLVTARPDPTVPFFQIPEGQDIYLTGVRADENDQWWLDTYFGLQPQSFPLVLQPEGWLVDLSPVFDPKTLSPADVALAEQVLAAGGDADAWLTVYAQLSNQIVDQGLLQLP